MKKQKRFTGFNGRQLRESEDAAVLSSIDEELCGTRRQRISITPIVISRQLIISRAELERLNNPSCFSFSPRRLLRGR